MAPQEDVHLRRNFLEGRAVLHKNPLPGYLVRHVTLAGGLSLGCPWGGPRREGRRGRLRLVSDAHSLEVSGAQDPCWPRGWVNQACAWGLVAGGGQTWKHRRV